MATITLNRTQHYYEDTGGEGPAILFIHGLFFDGRMFANQITALRDRYRCVSLDWRSQGRSEVAPFGHDVDGLVNDAQALIEALDLAPCHVVGVSLRGGRGVLIHEDGKIVGHNGLHVASAPAAHPTQFPVC